MVYTRQMMMELDRALLEDPNLDENEFFRRQLHEIRMQEALENDEYEEEDDPEPEDDGEEESFDEGDIEDSEDWDVDGFADDIEQSLSEEDDLSDETDEDFYEEEDFDEGEDSEPDQTYDPWTEDDHRQQQIRRGSEYSSNRGLHEVEDSYGDANYYFHMASEDGHGITPLPPSDGNQREREEYVSVPRTPEEQHERAMQKLATEYRRNEEFQGEEISDEPGYTDYTDFEYDIVDKAEDLILDYMDSGKEEEHFRKISEERYGGSEYQNSYDYQFYDLYRDLDHWRKFNEDTDTSDPIAKNNAVKNLHSALKAVEKAEAQRSKVEKEKEEWRERYENGELSWLDYGYKVSELNNDLVQQIMRREYDRNTGGSSVGKDIGAVMDPRINLVSDTLSENGEQMREARDRLSRMPRKAALNWINSAVARGLLSETAANHLKVMAVRPV